jgi:hypothetical protein
MFAVPYRIKPEAPEHLTGAVAKLRGAFHDCYQELLAQDPSARGYDALIRVEVRPDGRARASVDPGLPAALEHCFVRAVESGKTRFPRSAAGINLNIPVVLVWQGPPAKAP